jgi:hypothetical protein
VFFSTLYRRPCGERKRAVDELVRKEYDRLQDYGQRNEHRYDVCQYIRVNKQGENMMRRMIDNEARTETQEEKAS